MRHFLAILAGFFLFLIVIYTPVFAEIPIVTIPIPSSTSGGTIVINGSANHNDLQNIQGGTTNEYYHLTNAEWVNRIFLYNQSTPFYNWLVLFSNYNCPTGQVVNGTYGNGTLRCTAISSTSTYNATYANLINQNCEAGLVVNGTYPNGSLKCTEVTATSTYNATYANILNQDCPAGEVQNGTNADGSPKCTAQTGGTNYWENVSGHLEPIDNYNVWEPKLEVGATNKLFDVLGFFKSPDAVFSCQGTLSSCGDLLAEPPCSSISGCEWGSCIDDTGLDCSVYSQPECAAHSIVCSETNSCQDDPALDCSVLSEGDCLTASDVCDANYAGDCSLEAYPDCVSLSGCVDEGTSCSGNYYTSCSNKALADCSQASQTSCGLTGIGCLWNFSTCDNNGNCGGLSGYGSITCADYNSCQWSTGEGSSCVGSILDTNCNQISVSDCTSENTNTLCSVLVENDTVNIKAQAGVGQVNDTYQCLDSAGSIGWYSDYQCGMHTNNISSTYISTPNTAVFGGNPAMEVSSTTKITNLNADLLDGNDSSLLIAQGAVGDVQYKGGTGQFNGSSKFNFDGNGNIILNSGFNSGGSSTSICLRANAGSTCLSKISSSNQFGGSISIIDGNGKNALGYSCSNIGQAGNCVMSFFNTTAVQNNIDFGNGRQLIINLSATPSRFNWDIRTWNGTDNSTRIILTGNQTIAELNLTKTNLNVEGNVHIDGNVSFKRPYGMFSDTSTQTIASPNVAYGVTFNTTEDIWEVYKTADNMNFSFGQTGDYLIELSAVVVTDTNNKHVEIWVQKNGINVPRSNTKVEIPNAGTEQVIAVPFIIDMNMTDVFRVMYASDDAGTQLVYTPETSYSPSTPSIIMTISKISEMTL